MSAAKKGPPPFTTYTEVDINIDPEELEDAGWRYVGNVEADERRVEDVLAVIELWHNGAHAGGFRFCYEFPCSELRGLA